MQSWDLVWVSERTLPELPPTLSCRGDTDPAKAEPTANIQSWGGWGRAQPLPLPQAPPAPPPVTFCG